MERHSNGATGRDSPRPQKRKHREVVDLTLEDDAAPVKRAATPVNFKAQMPLHPVKQPVAAPANGHDPAEALLPVEAPTEPAVLKKPATAHQHEHQRRIEDDDDDDIGSDSPSMIEDILDTIELEPYVPSAGEMALPADKVTELLRELRQVGTQKLMHRCLITEEMSPRLLATAFGMDPEMDVDDDFFTEILRYAIARVYRKREKLEQYNTIDDAAQLLRDAKKIMVITGAGISTSLGIPDFRSKGTGFYDKVRELGFESGEDVFDIEVFDPNPQHFYSLAGDILPDLKRYTPTHKFIRLLQDKGKLQTNYTQNIDNLEELAGIDKDKLIQCHGSFATATCRKCGHKVPGNEIFADIKAKRVAHCQRCIEELKRNPPPKPKKKQNTFKFKRNDWESSSEEEDDNIPQPGVMKPDITFFNEKLPDLFFDRFTEHDSKDVDLVIVIGTSLKVAPVSDMSHYLPSDVPHVFISREPIEHINFDIQLLGDCDHVVFELFRRAGWELKHEMIPKDFQVDVRPVQGFNYRWTVRPRIVVPERALTPSKFGSLLNSIGKRNIDL